jgi:hypothetical protein
LMSDHGARGGIPANLQAGFKEPFLHITYYCGYVTEHGTT